MIATRSIFLSDMLTTHTMLSLLITSERNCIRYFDVKLEKEGQNEALFYSKLLNTLGIL